MSIARSSVILRVMRTVIHVNQHVIRRNMKTGEREPCLTVKKGRTNTYAHEVVFGCPHCGLEAGRIAYRPDRPLSCGAKVWVETFGEVQLELWAA